MVCGCLSMCPSRGASLAQVILPQRVADTDADALHVAHCLRSMRLFEVADVVLSSRGVHWIRQAKLQASKQGYVGSISSLSSLFIGLGSSSQGTSLSAKITRAAAFFMKSKDTSRLCAVFDAAITALVAAQLAVSAASDRYLHAVSIAGGEISDFECLHGLVLSSKATRVLLQYSESVGSGVDDIKRYISSLDHSVCTRDYTPRFISAESEVRLKEAVIATNVLNQTISNAKLLLDAVTTADVLKGITMAPVAERKSGHEIVSGSLGITLVRYIEALELSSQCAVLLRDRSNNDNRVLAACALKKACQLLVSLISRNSLTGDEHCGAFSIMDSVAPPRYQLYILDLCLCLHKKHAMLPLSPRMASTSIDAVNLSRKVFSRRQIDDLMCAFHQNTDTISTKMVYAGVDNNTLNKIEAAMSIVSSG